MQRRQNLALDKLPKLQERDERAGLQVRAVLAAPSLGEVLELVKQGMQAVME